MNMRDLCLMNADKTDISNTNRYRNQTPGIILPGENQLESQSAGDLYAEKQRSAGTAEEAENQRYQETKTQSDGSVNKPIRAQKVTTGKTATKTNLLENKRKPKISAGDPSIN